MANRFAEAMTRLTKEAESQQVRDICRMMFLLGAMRVRALQVEVAEATGDLTVDDYAAALRAIDDELDQCVYSEPAVIANIEGLQ